MDFDLVTNFYRLSPMQEGMLFHSLQGEGSGVDIKQLVCSLHEAVDAGLLRRAAQEVVNRHEVLRTSFHWEDLPEPRQTVHARADVSFAVEDWRGVPAASQEQKLAVASIPRRGRNLRG